VIEPRDSYYRGLKDKLFALQRVKADNFNRLEGSSPRYAMAKYCGHHRGRRAGHAFTGVTRELGRANCLLVENTVWGNRSAKDRLPAMEGRCSGPPLSLPRGGNTNESEHYKVSGDDSEERRSLRWSVGSLSGS
jgi:hypothetical protein